MEPFILRTAGSLKVAVLHDADAAPVFGEQAGKLFFFGEDRVLGVEHGYESFGEAAGALLQAGWTALPVYLASGPHLSASVQPRPGGAGRHGSPGPAGLAGMSPAAAARIWPHASPAERARRAGRLLAYEVQDFSCWLQGKAWRFVISDPRQGRVASCGGFYGEPEHCLAAGLDVAGQLIADRFDRRLAAGDGSFLNLDGRAVLASQAEGDRDLRVLIAPNREELAMLCGLARGLWQGEPGLSLHPERLLSPGCAGIASALDLADADFALRQAGASLEALGSRAPGRFFSRALRACFSASGPAGIQAVLRQTGDSTLILDAAGAGQSCRAAFPAECLQEALLALDREEERGRARRAFWRKREEEDFPVPETWREAVAGESQAEPAMGPDGRAAALPEALAGPLSGPGAPLPGLAGGALPAADCALAYASPGTDARGFPQGFPLPGCTTPEAVEGAPDPGTALRPAAAGSGGPCAPEACVGHLGAGHGRPGDPDGRDDLDGQAARNGQAPQDGEERQEGRDAGAGLDGEERGQAPCRQPAAASPGTADVAGEDGAGAPGFPEASVAAEALPAGLDGVAGPEGPAGPQEGREEACGAGPVCGDAGEGASEGLGEAGLGAGIEAEEAPCGDDGPDLLERGDEPGVLGDAEAHPDQESSDGGREGPAIG